MIEKRLLAGLIASCGLMLSSCHSVYMSAEDRLQGDYQEAAAEVELETVEELTAFAYSDVSVVPYTVENIARGFTDLSDEEIEKIFEKGLNHEAVTTFECDQYKTAFLLFIAKEYKRLGWVMQLHYGCKRDNNTTMYNKLGPDTGYDCISNYAPADQLTNMLDAINENGGLPKTILYSLNPGDDELIGTVLGCFQNSDAIGKIQQGSAWWFNDNKTGMEKQMTSLANLGLLGNFLGMLTDSRSFLSYSRHEYFRRIMCNLIGTWVENGEYPYDKENLTEIVKGISYNNAVRYFGFDL